MSNRTKKEDDGRFVIIMTSLIGLAYLFLRSYLQEINSVSTEIKQTSPEMINIEMVNIFNTDTPLDLKVTDECEKWRNSLNKKDNIWKGLP